MGTGGKDEGGLEAVCLGAGRLNVDVLEIEDWVDPAATSCQSVDDPCPC